MALFSSRAAASGLKLESRMEEKEGELVDRKGGPAVQPHAFKAAVEISLPGIHEP